MDRTPDKVNVAGVCLEGDEVTLRFSSIQEAADPNKIKLVPDEREPQFNYEIIMDDEVEANIDKSVQLVDQGPSSSTSSRKKMFNPRKYDKVQHPGLIVLNIDKSEEKRRRKEAEQRKKEEKLLKQEEELERTRIKTEKKLQEIRRKRELAMKKREEAEQQSMEAETHGENSQKNEAGAILTGGDNDREDCEFEKVPVKETDQVAQVLPGPSKKKRKLDPTSSTTSSTASTITSTESATIACTNERCGCTALFTTIRERNNHIKNCIYNVLTQCKDIMCITNGLGAFKSLNDLVRHAKNVHNCPTVTKKRKSTADTDEVKLPIVLESTLLFPKDNGYASKIVGTFDENVDGKDFHVVFFVIVDGRAKGDFNILPVLYGENGRMYHYFRMDLTLTSFDGKVIHTKSRLPHSSHYQKNKILTRALVSGKPVCDAIKTNQLLKFQHRGLAKDDDVIKLMLSFSSLGYRCNLKIDRNQQLLPYLLTEEELGIRKDAYEKLGWTCRDSKLAIPGILLPYLRTETNILIQCNELDQVLFTLMAVSLDKKTLFNKSIDLTTGDKVSYPISLILLPAKFMFEAIGPTIQKMANSLELTCTLMPEVDDDLVMDEFILKGCDVLVSNSATLKEMNKKKLDQLFYVLHKQLKFLIVPNFDYFVKKDCGKELYKFIIGLPDEVYNGLVKVAVSPLVTKEQQSIMMENFFLGSKCIIALLGPKHKSLFAPLLIFELDVVDCASKIEKVIQILQVHDKKKKWLILAEGGCMTYCKNFDFLSTKLKESFPERANCILRCDEETSIKESCFLPINKISGVIILSSYYSLQYEIIKLVGGVIVFSLPGKHADLMRLVPIVNTLDKPIYSLEYDETNSSDKVVKSFNF